MTGGGYSVGLYPGGTSEYAIGWSFTVPMSTSYQFESGSFVASLEPPMPAGNVQMQLYNDKAGVPGTVLDTMIVPGSELGTYSAFLDFTSTTHPILSAGATYWLIASMPQSGTSSLWWTPSVSTPGYEAVSYDGGAFSVAPNPQGAFAIYGTAVPEPSSIAMIAVALGGACVLFRAGRLRRGAQAVGTR
jgi:PEP-CTERM motif-containing protein